MDEPTNALAVKVHYLTTNDLCYLFQAVNEVVKRLLCAFADDTLPRKFEEQSYLVYITFTEQCAQVVDLLERAQLLFPEYDRQFDYGHPSINMGKTIWQHIRDRRGPPKVLVRCAGHRPYDSGTLATLHEVHEVDERKSSIPRASRECV